MKNIDTFLKNFDSALKNHIIEFGKELSALDADVFILMARKAACFVECLETIGLTRLNGKVTTDRVLDMNLEWLKNKKVVLIDDTIISGTTIHDGLKKLEKVGVSDASVMVFCIDKYWHQPDFIKFKDESCLIKPYLKLEHAECLKFCSNIVTALSLYPRPYSIDFPIYPNVRISFNQFENYFLNTDWKIHENTSKLQSQHQIKVFALSPNKNSIEKFENKLGIKISKLAHLKIRFYCREQINIKEEYSSAPHKLKRTNSQRNQRTVINYLVKIHPLVLFEPLDKKLIDEIFQEIKLKTIATTKYINSFNSISSKLRFIQYYFSFQLVTHWQEEFENYTNSNINLSISKRSLDYIFMNGNKYDISQLDLSTIDLSNIQIPIKNKLSEQTKSSEQLAVNPMSINSHLNKQFTELYHDEELPARRLVKTFGVNAFSENEYKKKLNRLKVGKSFQDLQESLIAFLDDKSSRRKAVSHFLDIAIDNGLVVPITCITNDKVYRAYRHGEDVIWGENNDRLIGYLFKSFKSATNSEEFAKVWFEKLFVIFLKTGINKNILFPYDYDTSPSEDLNIIGVRSYLFGQVSISYTISPNKNPDFLPIIDNDNRGFWTYDRLKDDGFITEKNSSFTIDTESLVDIYKLKNPIRFEDEPEDFTDESKFIAEELGDTFGVLSSEKIITQRDLVLLTSCLNPNDALNSIAAEVNLFYEKWQKNKKHLLESKLFEEDSDYIVISQSLRNPEKNISWTAINSGVFKLIGFKKREGFKRIEEISKNIKEHFKGREANYIQRSWLSYWPSNLDWQDERVPIISSLIDELGEWLLTTCFNYFSLDLLILQIAKLNGNQEHHISATQLEIDLIVTRISELTQFIDSKTKSSKLLQAGELDFELDEELNPFREELKSLKNTRYRKKEIIQQFKSNIDNTLIKILNYASDFENFYSDTTLLEKYKDLHEVILVGNRKDLELALKKYIQELNTLQELSKSILQQYKLAIPRWGKISEFLTYKYALYINPTNSKKIKSIEHHLGIELEKFEKELYKYNKEKQNTSFRLLPIHLTNNKLIIVVGGYNAEKRLIDVFYKVNSIMQSLKNENEDNLVSNFYLVNKLSKRYEIKIRLKSVSNEKDFVDFGSFNSIIEHIDKRTSDDGVYLIKDIDSNFIFSKNEFGTNKSNCLVNSSKEIETDKKNIHKYQMMEEVFTSVDIGIISIVEPEAKAIKEILEDNRSILRQPTNRYYEEGYIQGQNNRYKVAMTKQLSQGQQSVIAAYTALKEQYNPKFIILFGIAGGIHSDLKIGDVVIANTIIGYDKSKDRGVEGLSRRGITYNMEPELVRELGNFEDTYGENSTFKSHYNDEIFSTLIGPIGSGSSVIGSDLSKIRKWIVDFNDKTLAVETEAEGFCNFNYEEKLNRADFKHILIVRGISDIADDDKNTDEKTRRNLASKNAALVVTKFLESSMNVTEI